MQPKLTPAFLNFLSNLHLRVLGTNQFIPAWPPGGWCKIESLDDSLRITFIFEFSYNKLIFLTSWQADGSLKLKVESYERGSRLNFSAELYAGSTLIMDQINEGSIGREAVIPSKEASLSISVSPPTTVKKSHRRLERVAYITSRVEHCGITTYTRFLTEQINKNVATRLYHTIGEVADNPSLIHSQIEFGILPQKSMVLDGNRDRYKVVTWHSVFINPGGLLDYYQSVDQEYDAHIVHNALAKKCLSQYVQKPIYIIPHGSILFNPLEKTEARKKLDLPLDAQIVFAFGFYAENKGYNELLQVAERMKKDFPLFLLIISAAPHGLSSDQGPKQLVQRKGASTLILGRFLTEEEINLHLSSSDVLIFNYEDPPNVVSASGALHRCLASARPIVCSDVPRMADLADGRCALKFAPHNIDELERCLFLILSDPIMADHLGRNARILAEETSWMRIAQRHMEVYRMILQGGILYGPDYYDEAYFDTATKTYRTPNGQTHHWGYCKSSSENWLGWVDVVKGLQEVFNPERVLDAGTGTGGLIHFLLEKDVEAVGFDFSGYACHHAFQRARESMVQADACHIPFRDKAFDLVTVCDLLEHIYEEDLSKVIAEVQRLSRKFIFYNIGSVTKQSTDYYVLEKGKMPSIRWEPTAVSGHINVRPPSYWRKQLEGNGWKIRDDLEERFRQIVPKEVLANWQLIVVTEHEG